MKTKHPLVLALLIAALGANAARAQTTGSGPGSSGTMNPSTSPIILPSSPGLPPQPQPPPAKPVQQPIRPRTVPPMTAPPKPVPPGAPVNTIPAVTSAPPPIIRISSNAPFQPQPKPAWMTNRASLHR